MPDRPGLPWWLLLPALLLSPAGLADPQSKSWSNWNVQGTKVTANYIISARELTRLTDDIAAASLRAALQGELEERLRVSTEAGDCSRDRVRAGGADRGRLRMVLQWSCPKNATRLFIVNRAMQEATVGHIHFARINVEGLPSSERLFTAGTSRQEIPLAVEALSGDDGAVSATILAYAGFGFEHILVGVDHIAFLLGLILLAREWRGILLVVTGFTLGHSVTLALNVLGILEPEQAAVEGLIGYSIALVAIENALVGGSGGPGGANASPAPAAWTLAATLTGLALLGAVTGRGPTAQSLLGLALFSCCYLYLNTGPGRPAHARPLLTVLFGLVHGFGFAGVLLEVGIPAETALPALFGFNLGVEIGQLVLVLAMALPLIPLARLGPHWTERAKLALNASLCGLGTYWFVQRLYFPA